VRAYLNNQIMTDALVDDTGRWQMIPDAPVDPGLYRLRIDQLDALGKVTSRVETPFERAEPKIVADIVAQTQAQEAASDSATATSDTAVEQSRVQLESASEAAEALAAVASQAVNGAPVDGASEDGSPGDSGANQLASRESARTSVDTASASSESVSEETTPRRPTTVTIVPGNNLWTIARETYGDGIAYTVIFRANSDQIRDPDLIYPGQVFALPSRENPPAE
ncbi:MAG: LysM peptidoglycan-binding domain-containing protein, partial [Pseudomonadota bacterium]